LLKIGKLPFFKEETSDLNEITPTGFKKEMDYNQMFSIRLNSGLNIFQPSTNPTDRNKIYLFG